MKQYVIDNEKLLNEWDLEMNTPLTPESTTIHSNKKVWWKCEKGHKWIAMVNDRSRGNGCPYCSGNRVLIGYNDLNTTNPILASEWNYDKNKNIDPNHVSEHSNKIVWWICKYGHEWKSSINNRSNGNKCPICSSGNQTSFPEQAIFYYLNKVIDVKNRENVFGKEIDIWIPDLNIGIEYNGSYYHKNEEKDNDKILFFKNYGIKIITIRDGIENKTDKDVIVHKYNDIEYAIRAIFSILNLDCPEINIKNDKIKIYEKSSYYKNEKSLESVNPLLAKEWNYNRNGFLRPNMVAPNSSKKVWWICSKCKNEWESVIFSRNRGCGCPKCKIQKIKESNTKKVAQYDLEHNIIKEWSSMTAASNELDIALSLISKCCNGKIKTCGGFCWEYT